MRFVAAVFILAFAAALSPAQSREASTVSSLTVVVDDPAGFPIPSAWVRVQHWHSLNSETREVVADGEGLTNAKGELSVKLPMPSSSYEVFVSALGFVPGSAICQADRGFPMREVVKLNIFSGGHLEVQGH